MKKQIKNFALALVAGLFTLTATAAEKPTESKPFYVGLIKVTNSNKVNLVVSKPGEKWVSIYLKNDRNETLYSDIMIKRTKQFAKTFNLNEIEDGNYTFIVTDGKNTVEKELNIATNRPERVITKSIQVK
ncbi:hypothetical protein GVN16_20130 [Emticicia sp. CRIBPO]|uniref:hypothetical protein n=1 Tax=Emticicia sp. CRIBPO TaxID=2683258 RepID=UPI00141273CC|nr:hypothetical protein [Emticicia sp. CRIBPO]NBA88091.1 hypothetical protein [Emticicia sp. CRIBPO]